MTFGRLTRSVSGHPQRLPRGFSLLETLIVLAIILITTAIAVPLVQNITAGFKLQGAINNVKAGIQGARYQSIYQGCPFQIKFTAAPGPGLPAQYQIQTETLAAGGCGVAYTNVCPTGINAAIGCPVPLWGTGAPMTLNADVTLQFRPGGSVTSLQFPGGGINMTLTYTGQAPVNIQVSNYGSITP
jgi:prepilin-type N-terminal cleavage/methylation domain-containing protein